MMKNQLLNLVIVLGMTYSLSSCLKEEDNPYQAEETQEVLVPDNEMTTEETVVKRTDIKPLDQTVSPIIRVMPDNGRAEKRGQLTQYHQIPLQEYEKRTIECGAYRYADTRLSEPYFDNGNFYENWGLHTELDGRDHVYYLKITETSIVEFKLTGAESNLAMLLFKGDWGYNHSTYEVAENYEKLLAYSTSNSHEKEYLGPVQLEAGTYLLVVDSRLGYDSEYRLDICCTPVYDGCYNYGVQLRHDDFESYQEGYLCDQSPYWEKWNHNNPYNDARVYQIDPHYGQVMKVCYDPYKSGHYQDDVIYNLGESQNGIYELTFDMGVYKNRTGYFDIQKCLTQYNQYNEIGAKVYFKSDGRAYVLVNGQQHWFYYKNGYWMKVKLKFDFLDRTTKLYIDGDFICAWKTTYTYHGYYGSNKIEGLSFRPAYTNSCFVVDNICYSVVALI